MAKPRRCVPVSNYFMSDNGWENSAQAWIDDMDRGAVARTHLLDPIMLGLCETRPGLRALDVGCGEGRFCRMLRERGIEVVGIDPTESLLKVACERDPQGNYQLARAEELPFEDKSFDLIISYLTLIDIEDFRGAISEMVRVLKPGGTLVITNLTSMTTATPQGNPDGWSRDENGEKQFWMLNDYTIERPEWVEWRGIRIINWHRPLSAYMQAFLSQGLILEHYDEPIPTPEQLAQAPELSDHRHKPDFVVMRWRKKAGTCE
jgi:SAM-dependent methyltransferase